MNHQPEDCIVHVVDDDAALRRALRFLLDSVGWNVRLYASAEEFLDVLTSPETPSCLLLDIRMPSMSGLELQQVLDERGIALPIVFLTGHADVSMVVQAMKSGAADFIEKPFRDQVLLDAVATVITSYSIHYTKLYDGADVGQSLPQDIGYKDCDGVGERVTGHPGAFTEEH